MITDDMSQTAESVNGTDSVSTFDRAIFNLLLGRIEQLSRELGRAESQRAIVEQHVARLEKQLANLVRQQDQSS
jgi:hypothetical protein